MDPGYVAARRVLLNALFALEAHLDALVIAGAQAVYLHTGEVSPWLRSRPTPTCRSIPHGSDLSLSRGHDAPGRFRPGVG
jgi:hypothetical protein